MTLKAFAPNKEATTFLSSMVELVKCAWESNSEKTSWKSPVRTRSYAENDLSFEVWLKHACKAKTKTCRHLGGFPPSQEPSFPSKSMVLVSARTTFGRYRTGWSHQGMLNSSRPLHESPISRMWLKVFKNQHFLTFKKIFFDFFFVFPTQKT